MHATRACTEPGWLARTALSQGAALAAGDGSRHV